MSKKASEFESKEGILLTSDVKISVLFLPLFSEEYSVVFFRKISVIMASVELKNYDCNDWNLFMNSSKLSLQYVVLENESKRLVFWPITHSTKVEKEHPTIFLVKKKIR